MSSPVLNATDAGPMYLRPTSVFMLRTPIPPSQGTDPYHDAFGPFCLPSFPFSALESGSSTPLPPPINPFTTTEMSGADLLRNALRASKTGKRLGRWIDDDGSLTTHHLSSEPDDIRGTSSESDHQPPKREFCVTSVTILGHRTINTDKLADRLLNGSEQERDGKRRPFRGAIVTSQRAVEAWLEATFKASERVRAGAECRTNWARTPVFAVGPATAESLRASAKQIIQPLRPALVMGGGATGTAEALASYIVRHFNGPSGAAPGDELEVKADEPPLLYLTGDKNAPTIPEMLSAAKSPLEVETLMVYETALHDHFSTSCSTLARSLPPVPQSRPGSRRSSRSGSGSSARRPSVNSLFGNSLTAALERKRSINADGGSAHRSGTDKQSNSSSPAPFFGSTGPPLTAMTPYESQSPPLMASSPIEDGDLLPLDTDIGLGTGTGTKPDWIVFFSPSGIQYALDDLRQRRWLPGPYTFDADKQEYAKDSPESVRRRERWLSMGPPEGYPRIAVLGPTTKRWVRQQLGFQPDAVAASPGPTELREAIRMAEKRIRRERERLRYERELTEKQRKEDKARLVGVADGGGIPMAME